MGDVDRMGHEVGGLKQARFFRAGKVWNIAWIGQHSPLGSKCAEALDPESASQVVFPLGEYDQTTLRIPVIREPSFQNNVEAFADLLSGSLHGILAEQPGVLFNGGGKEHNSRRVA